MRLTFQNEKVRFSAALGVGLAVFSAPNFLGLQDWQVAFREAEAGYVVCTARENTQLRVGLGFRVDLGNDERGGSEVQKARASAVAPDGSLYILTDVNAATGGQAIKGSSDVALQKYDSAGNLIYTRTLIRAAVALNRAKKA